ncbi:hypothetical protein KA111_00115 [Candidatus Woesebacteria bacterium]|nr:hypothetical protein [Candidatus Woesebacteria bacterium]
MKKYTPYIFPLVVLGVIFLLVFRWYSMKTERLDDSSFAEGVEIENLSQDELVKSINGVGDYASVNLNSKDEDTTGVVRYEVKDDKVRFSVMANLPESDEEYNVWLKEVDGTEMREVFSLVSGKGGYIGSAALPSELLPFEIIVSQEKTAKGAMDTSILNGVIKEVENSEMMTK